MTKQIVINKYVTIPACAMMAILASCSQTENKEDYSKTEIDKAVQTISDSSERVTKRTEARFVKMEDSIQYEVSEAYNDAKEEIDNLGSNLSSYEAEEKEKALDKIVASLDQIDAEIDKFDDWYDQNENKMSGDLKEEYSKAVKNLEEQRNEVAEWENKLENSTPDTWDKIKTGFVNSYNAMSESVNDLFTDEKSEKELKDKVYVTVYRVSYYEPDSEKLKSEIDKLSVEEKEEAMEIVDDHLENLDQQIEDYEDWCGVYCDELKIPTSQAHMSALKQMKEHRAKVQDLYDRLDESTPDTWDKIKGSFVSTYNEMTEYLDETFDNDTLYSTSSNKPVKRLYANTKSHLHRAHSVNDKEQLMDDLNESIEEVHETISEYEDWYNDNKQVLENREFYKSNLTQLKAKRDHLLVVKNKLQQSNESEWTHNKNEFHAAYIATVKAWNDFVDEEEKENREYVQSLKEMDKMVSEAQESSKESLHEIKVELKETASEIDEFTVEKRRDAIKEVTEALEEMDEEIAGLESWFKQHKASLQGNSHERYEESIADLKEERDQVEKWLNKLKTCEDKEWNSTKSEFSKAYSSMIDTLEQF